MFWGYFFVMTFFFFRGKVICQFDASVDKKGLDIHTALQSAKLASSKDIRAEFRTEDSSRKQIKSYFQSRQRSLTTMTSSTASIVLLIVVTLLLSVNSFQPRMNRATYRQSALSMGFMDALTKAMANDPSLPPPVNPGLRSVESSSS